MTIYVHKNGVRLGPLELDDVNARVAKAEFGGTDPAWISGWPKWQTLSCVPGFILREEPPPFDAVSDPPPMVTPSMEPPPMEAPPIAPPPMAAMPVTPEKSIAQVEDDPKPILFYIPTARLLVMSILTFGIYQVLWFYRNWKFLRDRRHLEVSPFGRALFSIFYTHSLFRYIAEYNNLNDRIAKQFSPGGWATLWVVACFVTNALSRNIPQNQPLLLLVLPLLPVCFVLPAQNCIIRVNEVQPIRPAYDGWSAGQFILLILGIVWWALILIGAMQAA